VPIAHYGAETQKNLVKLCFSPAIDKRTMGHASIFRMNTPPMSSLVLTDALRSSGLRPMLKCTDIFRVGQWGKSNGYAIIQRAVENGDLRPCSPPGSALRFHADDVERWFDKLRSGARSRKRDRHKSGNVKTTRLKASAATKHGN